MKQYFGELPDYYLTAKNLKEVPTWVFGSELFERLKSDTELDFTSAQFIPLFFNLQKGLEKRLEVFENHFSLKRLEGLFFTSYRYWTQHQIPIKGATYVDVGCGSINPFGLLFLFIMLGAKRGICLDPDPIRDLSTALSSLANIAGKIIIEPTRVIGNYPITRQKILENLASFDLGNLAAGRLEGLDQDRFSFQQGSILQTSLKDDEADVVLSHSVLEHLPNIDVAVAELYRITNPGGYGIYNIDGVDHWSYGNTDSHPLEFLKIESEEEIVHLSNRIRPLNFVKIFEKQGFSILEVRPYTRISVDGQLRASFVEPFRTMPQEWLEITQACVLVRKKMPAVAGVGGEGEAVAGAAGDLAKVGQDNAGNHGDGAKTS